jgi:Ankyrin repeat
VSLTCNVTYLVSAGADVNAVNFLGNTPLMHAQTVETLQLLLDAGADVNARSSVGSTVLHVEALYSADLDRIACLLAAGADATATDTVGSTPAETAAAEGHTAAAALLQKAEAEQRSMQSHQRAAPLAADLHIAKDSREWRRSKHARQREDVLQRMSDSGEAAERSDRVELLQRAEFELYAHAASLGAYFASDAISAMIKVLCAVPEAGADRSQWRQRRVDLQTERHALR